MNQVILVLAFGLLTAPLPGVRRIQDEPMHHLKLENEYVRVFDVVVPPHRETFFHQHDHDYVFVSLGAATVRSERPDGTSTVVELKDGEARFTAAPLAHRAVNLADTPFHNVTVEILKTAGSPAEEPMPAMPGHSVILENEKIRIDRQVLDPGQSTPLHTHMLMSLGICLSAATIEYTDADGKETATLQPGQFSWHSAARTHTLKNVGKTRFEAIEIEWK